MRLEEPRNGAGEKATTHLSCSLDPPFPLNYHLKRKQERGQEVLETIR